MRTNSFSQIDGSPFTFGIVRARFNEQITQNLLDAAKEVLHEAGVPESSIKVVEVPGSYEIPLVAAELAKQKVDGVLALGCIIKGETTHDEHLAMAVFPNLARLAMETGVPITAGILTVLNKEQAEVRSGDTEMNRGRESARTALEMAETMRALRS